MNLEEFQILKLNIDETMSVRGGSGGACATGSNGLSTVSAGNDTDCKRRDCDHSDDSIVEL